MTEVTIQIPDELADQLEPFGQQIPDFLERGMHAYLADGDGDLSADENNIISLLASNPAPEDVLLLKPSEKTQARASMLMSKSKAQSLTREEESELAQIL